MAEDVPVEVVYALPDRPVVSVVVVSAGASLREAIERSGILGAFPEIDLRRNRVGSFGRLRGLEEPVQPGDRVEIYRSLPADPKEMRRQRARK